MGPMKRKPRNVRVGGRRTSMRLEREFWEALEDIAGRHETSVGELCTLIADSRDGRSLSSAVRVEILAYYRRCFAAIDQAATVIRDGPRIGARREVHGGRLAIARRDGDQDEAPSPRPT